MGYEVLIVGDADSSDAICSFLHKSLTHIGEFQVKMLEAISREYGISIEKLVDTVHNPPVIKTKKGRKVILKNFI